MDNENNFKLSDFHKKILAARDGDMSAFESQDEYDQYKDQASLLDPSNFMGMGTTRAVKELGPTMGKMMNKLGKQAKAVDTNRFSKLLPHFNEEMDFAKFLKDNGDTLPTGMLDNLKYSQKQLGPNYESLKNSRNYNNKTDWDRLLGKGMDASGYPAKDYNNLEKNIIAEQDIIGEAGYSKLKQLLSKIKD